MLSHLSTSGSIEHIGHLYSRDRACLAVEVNSRAVALSKLGVGGGSVVAIARGNGADLFADLFAVWTLSASTACLDNSLTGVEPHIRAFAEPAVPLIGGNAAAVEAGISINRLCRLKIAPHCQSLLSPSDAFLSFVES
jgi:hypothetical protein